MRIFPIMDNLLKTVKYSLQYLKEQFFSAGALHSIELSEVTK